MALRRLRKSDALLMLEWMQDEAMEQCFHRNFRSYTIKDCEEFISASLESHVSLHMAVVDEQDCYQGTVSLKNIAGGKAEFAIVICPHAQGTGLAGMAMQEIIHYGLHDINLDEIYWNVKKTNKRAIRFYAKQGFMPEYEDDSLLWYKAIK